MSKVLILHTGGTLGMTGEELVTNAYAQELTAAVPQLREIAEVESRVIANLDSSDIGPKEWTKLAKILHKERENYCGFVVVHGTDTMAYSASAMSFALVGFGKPIVFTGAQRPLLKTRTDARRNLIDAVEVATLDIPEVTICFDGLLFRGCRATKESAVDYRAFASPGTRAVARLGVEIRLKNARPCPESYSFLPNFSDEVRVVMATPSLNGEQFLRSTEGAKGIILVSFGLGTVPCLTHKVSDSVSQRVKEGCDVLVITQSSGRIELGKYQNSRKLRDAGAIPGGRLGLEAAVAKMLHALENIEDRDARRVYLENDIVGEHN